MINENTMTSQRHDKFHGRSPYLKLEIFLDDAQPPRRVAAGNMLFRSSTTAFIAEAITGSAADKAAILKYLPEIRFDPMAQVLRKSDAVCLRITATDKLSLSAQHKMGLELMPRQNY